MRVYPGLELGVGFLKILDKYRNGDIAAGAFKDPRTRGRGYGPIWTIPPGIVEYVTSGPP